MREIMARVDPYNRRPGHPMSHFIARGFGLHSPVFARVCEEVGEVSIEELDEFLTRTDAELPQDHLIG